MSNVVIHTRRKDDRSTCPRCRRSSYGNTFAREANVTDGELAAPTQRNVTAAIVNLLARVIATIHRKGRRDTSHRCQFA